MPPLFPLTGPLPAWRIMASTRPRWTSWSVSLPSDPHTSARGTAKYLSRKGSLEQSANLSVTAAIFILLQQKSTSCARSFRNVRRTYLIFFSILLTFANTAVYNCFVRVSWQVQKSCILPIKVAWKSLSQRAPRRSDKNYKSLQKWIHSDILIQTDLWRPCYELSSNL